MISQCQNCMTWWHEDQWQILGGTSYAVFFLPRYIAKDIPGYILEVWFRLDHRLEMNDILMRIERDNYGSVPSGNTLSMRRICFRETFGASAWERPRAGETAALGAPLPSRILIFVLITRIDILSARIRAHVCLERPERRMIWNIGRVRHGSRALPNQKRSMTRPWSSCPQTTIAMNQTTSSSWTTEKRSTRFYSEQGCNYTIFRDVRSNYIEPNDQNSHRGRINRKVLVRCSSD